MLPTPGQRRRHQSRRLRSRSRSHDVNRISSRLDDARGLAFNHDIGEILDALVGLRSHHRTDLRHHLPALLGADRGCLLPIAHAQDRIRQSRRDIDSMLDAHLVRARRKRNVALPIPPELAALAMPGHEPPPLAPTGRLELERTDAERWHGLPATFARRPRLRPRMNAFHGRRPEHTLSLAPPLIAIRILHVARRALGARAC